MNFLENLFVNPRFVLVTLDSMKTVSGVTLLKPAPG